MSEQSAIAVSRIYGLDGISDSYSPHNLTIRKNTGNLPIAGKNTKGSLFPPFLCKCFFPKIFLKKKVKNYCSLVTKERYKFIKPDRILSAENIKIVSFKILKTIEICGTGEGIYNKTANKLSKSLGIVIGNGPLKISNFQ